MAARSEKKQAPPPDLSFAETRALVHLNLDRLYRQQLDEPIPMLGDVSPRTAIRSKKEREKVVSWIKTLENHMAHVPSDDPMAGYEQKKVATKLGVEAAVESCFEAGRDGFWMQRLLVEHGVIKPCGGADEDLGEPARQARQN